MRKFIGRRKELQVLNHLKQKTSSSLVVIRGRRRIGKSRLAEEFGRNIDRSYIFTGLPPEPGVKTQTQRDEFERQLFRYKIPTLRSDDWGDLFWSLSEHCKKGAVLIVLDEISWMGSKDPSFLGKLKIIWDQHFSKNPHLILIISGSNSTWIDENILSSTGFVGRISQTIDLKELPISDCYAFWGHQKRKIAPYEVFKILGITGGVPRYLEEIQAKFTAEDNILTLCFQPGGLLFNEFDQIFSDLFSRRSAIYKEIILQLINGPLAQTEITKKLGRTKSGDLSAYLKDLCQTGFLSRDYTWSFKQGKLSKLSRFRLSDNYVRFYLRYIEPNKPKIINGEMNHLPSNWLSIMGLQFENLVVNNRIKLYRALKIPSEEIVAANPYFQTENRQQKGCQIDFIVQTQYNVLYVCEIKFRSSEVTGQVINDMEEKLKRLYVPKGFSIRPILIHVNGVVESVKEKDYFAQIIDFGTLLEPID
jgi:uncharacterized protein